MVPCTFSTPFSPDIKTGACVLSSGQRRREREWIVVGWVVLLFHLALLKCPPLPGWAGEKHISTVCDYTVLSTFNSERACFIFVGCETFLSGVQRNAGRNDGYFAWRKQYLVSRSCPPAPFSLGCQSKDPMPGLKCKEVWENRCRKESCVDRERRYFPKTCMKYNSSFISSQYEHEC